jgi:hypothetical protein
MRALTTSTFASDAWRDRSAKEGPKVSSSRSILQVAVNLVFGAPFLWCLLVAIRGRVLWDSHRIFGDAIGRNFALIWVMAAALGALWLGVTVMLAPTPGRRPAGGILVLLGFALLVGFHP